MFVRMTTLQTEKGAVQAGVDYIENTARAAVEAAAGNRGFATFTDAASGVVVGASYWDSAEARAASESALADVRAGLATAGGGDVTIANYEAAVAKRRSIPAAGAVVRVVRLELDEDKVEDLIAYYRSDILPVLVSAGTCSAQLVIDRAAGKALGVSSWDDEAALANAQAALAPLPAALTAHLSSAKITGIELYSMVRTTVRMD